MWDQRYATDEYVYGTKPNDFLLTAVADLPPQRVLCLAEGEGRNAVYLASLGHEVLAVDASAVGLAKAQRLAAQRGVRIVTEVADLATFSIAPDSFGLIVSIFCHLLPPVRQRLYRQAVLGLRPGGRFILEGYASQQLGRTTGGPQVPELLYDLATLRTDLAGLRFIHAQELERELHEGRLHDGVGAVVQVVGLRPESV